jgi:hypothetical protein
MSTATSEIELLEQKLIPVEGTWRGPKSCEPKYSAATTCVNRRLPAIRRVQRQERRSDRIAVSR